MSLALPADGDGVPAVAVTARPRRRRSAALVAVLTLLVATLALIATSTAASATALATTTPQATGDCGGTRVYTQPWNDIDGNPVARLDYYANNATENDCFKLLSVGRWKGISKYMSLTVCGSTCKSNSGNFASYAGPVTVNFGAQNCFSLYLIVREPNGRTILHEDTYGGKCN